MSVSNKKLWSDLQKFLVDYEQFYESRTHATEDYMRLVQGKSMKHSEIKQIISMEYFDQSLVESKVVKDNKNLEKALQIWPLNLHARVYKLLVNDNQIIAEKLKKLIALEKEYFPWVENGQISEINYEAYLRLVKTINGLCRETGLYSIGEQYALKGLGMEPDDPLDYRYDLANFYVYLRRYTALRALYLKYDSNDFTLTMNVIFAAILHLDFDYAKDLLKKLNRRIKNLYLLFDPETFNLILEEIISGNELGDDMDVSIEKAALAIYPLLSLYSSSEILLDFFDMHLEYSYSNYDDPYVYDKDYFGQIQEEKDGHYFDTEFKEFASEYFQGIEDHRSYLIYKAGYNTVEALQKATFEDIIAIDGIGKVTAEKLRDNGFPLLNKKK